MLPQSLLDNIPQKHMGDGPAPIILQQREGLLRILAVLCTQEARPGSLEPPYGSVPQDTRKRMFPSVSVPALSHINGAL